MYKINVRNITTDKDSNKDIIELFVKAIGKIKQRKERKKRLITEKGRYCPRVKPGQCWAFSDKKEENEGE